MTLSLTFDDGPDPIWTDKILDRLRHVGVVATFFVIAERVSAEPDLVRRALAAGHQVQFHCHRHTRHSAMTEVEIARDATLGLAVLADLGVRPTIWRPPWGVCTVPTRRVAERHDLELTRWSIDTHDWRGDGADTMLDAAVPHFGDGGSILMHDGLGPGSTRSGCENTLDFIDRCVATAHAQGIAFVPARAGDRLEPTSPELAAA